MKKTQLIKVLRAQNLVLKERERCGYNVPLTKILKKYEFDLCIGAETLRRYMRMNVKKELTRIGIDWREYI